MPAKTGKVMSEITLIAIIAAGYRRWIYRQRFIV